MEGEACPRDWPLKEEKFSSGKLMTGFSFNYLGSSWLLSIPNSLSILST